jgi:hypothetical protein
MREKHEVTMKTKYKIIPGKQSDVCGVVYVQAIATFHKERRIRSFHQEPSQAGAQVCVGKEHQAER